MAFVAFTTTQISNAQIKIQVSMLIELLTKEVVDWDFDITIPVYDFAELVCHQQEN